MSSFYLMQTVSVLYRRSFGQRGRVSCLVYFGCVSLVALEWTPGGEGRAGGDILVFTMRRFKENVTSRVTHVFWRLRLRSTTRTSEKGLNVKLNFARSSVKS